jgi:hypothetical protein
VRAVYCLKGSAGLRPCLLCKNVLKLNSELTAHDAWFVEIHLLEVLLQHQTTKFSRYVTQ